MARDVETQILLKLISLKKKRAERQLADMQQARQRIDLEMQALRLALSEMHSKPDGFDAVKLAVQNRFPERTAKLLESLKVDRQALAKDIAGVERDLAVALHATQVLDKPI